MSQSSASGHNQAPGMSQCYPQFSLFVAFLYVNQFQPPMVRRRNGLSPRPGDGVNRDILTGQRQRTSAEKLLHGFEYSAWRPRPWRWSNWKKENAIYIGMQLSLADAEALLRPLPQRAQATLVSNLNKEDLGPDFLAALATLFAHCEARLTVL
jgi:hypothetical protein